MSPSYFKITLVREFPNGFCSVILTHANGREDFWVLSDTVIHKLMERQVWYTSSCATA